MKESTKEFFWILVGLVLVVTILTNIIFASLYFWIEVMK